MRTWRITRIRPSDQTQNSIVTSRAVGDTAASAFEAYVEGGNGDLITDTTVWSREEDIFLVQETGTDPDPRHHRLLRVAADRTPRYRAVEVACVA